MIITKIFNNNAVFSLDDNGEEIVVKGKGIAFQKKAGDIVEEERIEKIFISDNKEIIRQYKEVLLNIPYDCIDACEDMIDVIKEKINKNLSDQIYITLTDHINNLLERFKMGIVFDNGILWDIKHLYKKEYDVGLLVVEMIRKTFNIRVDDEEASFIALHIVNAENDITDLKDILEITAMMESVYDIVESDFSLEIDKESLDYSRFIFHLRIFFERILKKENFRTEKNEKLLDALKEQYPIQQACVDKILRFVSNHYDEPLDGEVLYLLVHVIKLTVE